MNNTTKKFLKKIKFYWHFKINAYTKRAKEAFRGMRLILFVLILFFLVWFYPYKIPNFLSITSPTAAIEVLSAIIGGLAAILGIVVAVLLVAFEILRRMYAAYAFKDFFKNQRLRELSVLYISTILIALLSLAGLEEPLSLRNMNLLYLSVFLFSISLIALFPYSISIISGTQSKKKIKDLVSKIDHHVIQSFAYSRPHTYIGEIEENPVFILTELATRIMKEDNHLTPRFVLSEASKRLREFLKGTIATDDIRITINVFLVIIKNTAHQAISQRQGGILQTVIEVIEETHITCAEKGVAWHKVIELNQTFEEILNRAMDAELDEVVKRGFWALERIFENHVTKNVPSEDKIWILHIGRDTEKTVTNDTDKDLQWDNVSREYVAMLSRLIERAISLKISDLLIAGLLSMRRMAEIVVKSSLGDLQKAAILSRCYYYQQFLTLKAADEGLSRGILGSCPFGYFGVTETLEKKAEFSREPLLRFSDTLIKLAEKGCLSTDTLNELGAIGRHCVHLLNQDELFAKSIIFIVRTFDRIREIVERNPTEEDKNIYLQLYAQIESLKKWMTHEKKKNPEIEKEIESTLSYFKKLQDYRKEQKRGILEWPS